MRLKVYEYKNCGTCRKALKFLADHKVEFETIPIRERPPTKTELRRMLGYYQGDVRRLFNTSGQEYRALDLKTKLSRMTADEAIELLAKNGKLVKRPFALTQRGGLVGFNQAQWQGFLLLQH